MTNNPAQPRQSADEAEIYALIERWSRAVRHQDRAEIRKACIAQREMASARELRPFRRDRSWFVAIEERSHFVR
jgi:hypothetical protein